MNKIKIGYFADGPWSHEAFDRMINNNQIEIQFIVPRYNSNDSELLKRSKKFNIDYFKHKNVNSDDFIDKVEKCQWKSITKWSDISAKDNKRGIKNRGYYFS